METTLIYQNPNPLYHADFPNIALGHDNSINILLRKCGHWAYEANFKHNLPTFFDIEAEIIIIRSTDNGQTFKPLDIEPLLTGMAVEPVITRLADGRLLAGGITGDAGKRSQRKDLKGILHRHFPTYDTVITFEGVALAFSSDNGLSWSHNDNLVIPFPPESIYNLRKPLELADGTILMPFTIGYPWRSRFVGLSRSFDAGKTFGDDTYIAEDPQGRRCWAAGTDYWQPTLAAAPNGDMICVFVEMTNEMTKKSRISSLQSFQDPLLCSHSYDGGYTWSPPEPTGLTGSFPALTKLQDNRFLLTYTTQTGHAGTVEAAISIDGQTWKSQPSLRNEKEMIFHYSDSVHLPDGDIFTTYMTTPSGKARIIEATHWKP